MPAIISFKRVLAVCNMTDYTGAGTGTFSAGEAVSGSCPEVSSFWETISLALL
jgi:hypothetical protein